MVPKVFSRVLDSLKPHRAEALQRVRTNAFCLVVLIVLTYLVPVVPGVHEAVRCALAAWFGGSRGGSRTIATSRGDGGWATTVASVPPQMQLQLQRWTGEWVFSWVCTIETALATIFLLNVLQGVYALKYPRPPPPPPSSHPKSPSKGLSKGTPSTPLSLKSIKHVSPSTRAGGSQQQQQQQFTFSTSASNPSATSLSSSSPSGGLPKSQSQSGNLYYPSTPADTPSGKRGSVKYMFASPSGLDSPPPPPLGASSGSAGPATPTPWRGRYLGLDVGRSLDGSFLESVMRQSGEVVGEGEEE